MKNVIELRKELCSIYHDLKNDAIEIDRAKELTNTAGKIISSVKLELVYAALRKESPVIDFLGGELSPQERSHLLSATNGAPIVPRKKARNVGVEMDASIRRVNA